MHTHTQRDSFLISSLFINFWVQTRQNQIFSPSVMKHEHTQQQYWVAPKWWWCEDITSKVSLVHDQEYNSLFWFKIPCVEKLHDDMVIFHQLGHNRYPKVTPCWQGFVVTYCESKSLMFFQHSATIEPHWNEKSRAQELREFESTLIRLAPETIPHYFVHSVIKMYLIAGCALLIVCMTHNEDYACWLKLMCYPRPDYQCFANELYKTQWKYAHQQTCRWIIIMQVNDFNHQMATYCLLIAVVNIIAKAIMSVTLFFLWIL